MSYIISLVRGVYMYVNSCRSNLLAAHGYDYVMNKIACK